MSVAEQQSHKEKLENARATRGHRRTQSNSQYEFTQLKVSAAPVEELSEEAKRNKEEFNKIVEQNRIIGANLTQQALEAQKNSKEEKKTIIDCIDEDLIAVNSAENSTFAFGKKLCHGMKKRHNSDVIGALYRQSQLESGNGFKNGVDNCSLQKEEDDDESEDDFDSLFFAKYKKFGGAGRLTLPVGSGDGLSIIPELATDLVTSTEFGTSMFKDNNLANHNSNSNSLPTNNSNKSLPNHMDKALTSNSNNSTNLLGGKQCLTTQNAGVEHLPQINNLTHMNVNNKCEDIHNLEHKIDKNNKLDGSKNLPSDLHEFQQRTLLTYDNNNNIYNSTQNPSLQGNHYSENEGVSHPPKKIKDSQASAALSSLVASLKNSQALNSNSNNNSNINNNQILYKTTQPTELETADTQPSIPSRSPTVGQSATRPQHQRGESSLQFGQNPVQSFLPSNEGSQQIRSNKRNSIHEILGASNNLSQTYNTMSQNQATKNYYDNQQQQQPLEYHNLHQQKDSQQPRYHQSSQHPSELYSIVEILPSPKDQCRQTGNTQSLLHPQFKTEQVLDSKENQLPLNHNHPQMHFNNSKKTQNLNYDSKIQQDSSIQPQSSKHQNNKSCTSSSLQVSAAIPQIISTSTTASTRTASNKNNNQFQNAVSWLQHSSILPLASDKSSKSDIPEQQQYQHSRTGSSSIVNVSNLVSSSTFSAHNYSNNNGANNSNNLVASSILASRYESNNSNNNNNNPTNFNHANYPPNNTNNNVQRNLNNTSSSNSGSSSSSVLSPAIGDMDTQSKTYSQIIKDFLYKSNNSTTNSQYQQMHQEQQLLQQAQYSISTNNNTNKPQSSSKKISSLASKDTKKPSPSAGMKQSTTSVLSTNGNSSLEGRIFMLESKVLSLKCKTETLEKQNLNLTQEVMKISDEKDICLKENIENKQRLHELEGITRRNEESIQLIYKMLCKSQSDYELLKAQKTQQFQEASTNVFTDLSCIESPNEVRAGSKQVLLPKNMNQIVENQFQDCNPYKNSHSAHSSNRDKDGMKNNNQNLKMVSPSTYTNNSTKFHNENSSFNSLLQQRKHQSYKPQQGQQYTQQSPYQQQQQQQQIFSNGVNIHQNPSNGYKQGMISHSQYQPHRLL